MTLFHLKELKRGEKIIPKAKADRMNEIIKTRAHTQTENQHLIERIKT